MEKFNRERQKKLLEHLYDSYPAPLKKETYQEIVELFENDDIFAANLLYLESHELIKSGLNAHIHGYAMNYPAMKITAKGIDFIQHDGGLSAILNIQTIKFHKDAVVVFEDLIAISNMTENEKEKAKSTLSELSTEALKTLVQTVTVAGLTALSR